MKHLGDITKISGYDVPLVDIVCGGSPCQDLSVAVKRAGLAGERSGLFMEQIRIIKEMRERSKEIGLSNDDIRPRFMVWENVPGAFSSNKGEDFRAVLEETAKVVCKDAVIPEPEKGKWSNSGCIMGDGWSIAWRVHDAQFWGVPQRRKRISLVADFGGESAPEILFEREGMSGNTEQSKQTREEVTRTVGNSIDPSSYTLKIRGGCDVDSNGKKAGKGPLVQTELSGTLGVSQDQTLITKESKCYGISSYESNSMKSANPNSGIYEANTSRTLDVGGGNPACNQGGVCVVEPVYCLQGNSIDRADTAGCNGKGWRENQSYKLNTIDRPAVCVGNGQLDQLKMSDKVGALNCMHDQQAVMVFNEVHASLSAADGYKGVHSQMLSAPEDNFVMGFNRERCGAVTSVEKMPTLQAAAGESGNNQPMICYTTQASGDRNNPTQSYQEDKAYTIPSNPMSDRGQAICYAIDQGAGKSSANFSPDIGDNTSGEPAVCYGVDVYNQEITGDVSASLTAACGGTNTSGGKVLTEKVYGVDTYNNSISEEKTMSMTGAATDSHHIPCVTYGIDRASFNQGQNAKYDFSVDEELAQPIVARGPGGY